MSNSDRIRRRAPVPMDQCGAALAAEILADRWTLLIIREAFYGVTRYDDIRADIGIPRSVLTTRLKRMVAEGILRRVPYQEAGARTRYGYQLTGRGRDLGLIILALMQWGDTHLKGGVPALAVTHRQTGAALQVGLVDDPAAVVPLSDVRIKPLV